MVIRAIRKLALWGVCASAGLLLLGLGGRFHPVFDSLAVGRGLAVVAVLGFGLIALGAGARQRWILALVAGGALQGGTMVGLAVPGSDVSGPSFEFYQQNLLYARRGKAAWLDHIRRHELDVIAMQEVGAANLDLLEALRPEFPHQYLCERGGLAGGSALVSRFPVVAGTESCVNGLALMQVQTEAGPLWVGSVHLYWPWPYSQAEQVEELLPVIAALDGPRVIGGDFNQVAWSATVRRMARAFGGERAGARVSTFTLPLLDLRIGIDHVLVGPGQGAWIEAEPGLGSDHNGIRAVIGL